MTTTVWLASYPKSGNTWFRLFMARLLHPDQHSSDLNSLPLYTPIASSRRLFDDMLGVPSAFLTAGEIAALRPDADAAFNEAGDEPRQLRKAHDAYTYLPDGRPLLSQAPNFAAIYILRDPWDVAVSFASHFNCTLDEAVRRLRDSHLSIARNPRELNRQLEQRLLSWEGHVLSWLSAPLPLHVMRFEEMKRAPLRTFRAAVRFLGLDHDDRAIEAALAACRIERLQQMETETRFNEAPQAADRFFRRGEIGEGVTRLSEEQLRPLLDMYRRVERAISENAAQRG